MYKNSLEEMFCDVGTNGRHQSQTLPVHLGQVAIRPISNLVRRSFLDHQSLHFHIDPGKYLLLLKITALPPSDIPNPNVLVNFAHSSRDEVRERAEQIRNPSSVIQQAKVEVRVTGPPTSMSHLHYITTVVAYTYTYLRLHYYLTSTFRVLRSESKRNVPARSIVIGLFWFCGAVFLRFRLRSVGPSIGR